MALFDSLRRNKHSPHLKDGNALSSAQDIAGQDIEERRIETSAERDMVFIERIAQFDRVLELSRLSGDQFRGSHLGQTTFR